MQKSTFQFSENIIVSKDTSGINQLERCQDRYADTFDPSEFPGQYKHLGPALVARGDDVYSLTPTFQKDEVARGQAHSLNYQSPKFQRLISLDY